MHIAVFGVGGVGGYFGGRLAQAGETVTFIARGKHLQAMLATGLQVESIKGDFVIYPVTATDDTTKVNDVDVVLVCVKAWQLISVAQEILPMIGSNTFIVPLENGVEAPSQLAGIFGRQHVLGGVCLIESHIVSPGHIQHTEIDEPYIQFGELDNHPSSRALKLRQSFERAGVDAKIPPDINLALWQKSLIVSPISGIGAVTRVPVGEWRSFQGLRQLFERTIRECYSVAIAQGIHMTANIINDRLAYIDTLPSSLTTSLQRDIMYGRPSELEAQIGVVVRMGQMLNIPTPIYAYLYQCLLPQEKIARGEIH